MLSALVTPALPSPMVVAAAHNGVALVIGVIWKLAANKGRIEKAKYRQIHEENLFQSVGDLCLGQIFMFQQDNDPKHTAIKLPRNGLKQEGHYLGMA